jgi:hypothetical protein
MVDNGGIEAGPRGRKAVVVKVVSCGKVGRCKEGSNGCGGNDG